MSDYFGVKMTFAQSPNGSIFLGDQPEPWATINDEGVVTKLDLAGAKATAENGSGITRHIAILVLHAADWAAKLARPLDGLEAREAFLLDLSTIGEREGWSFSATWEEDKQRWDDMYVNWMWWAWSQARTALAAQRGTDAQILKEREIAGHAIVGALAAGYGGQQHPGADHWLAAAHDAGVKIRELESAQQSEPSEPKTYDAADVVLLSAAAKTGSSALGLALQLTGQQPCDECGYVKHHCRCATTTQTQAAQQSPTAGMTLWERIQHVGGRQNAATYIEFGSVQAVKALVSHVLRDIGASWELRPDQWSEVVAEELTLLHLPCPEDPREAIKALVAAQTRIALDPAVSREALALVERGRASANVLTRDEIEQAGFEKWVNRVLPHGDVEQIQEQWLASTDFEEVKPAALMAEIGHWRAKVQSLQAQMADQQAPKLNDPAVQKRLAAQWGLYRVLGSHQTDPIGTMAHDWSASPAQVEEAAASEGWSYTPVGLRSFYASDKPVGVSIGAANEEPSLNPATGDSPNAATRITLPSAHQVGDHVMATGLKTPMLITAVQFTDSKVWYEVGGVLHPSEDIRKALTVVSISEGGAA